MDRFEIKNVPGDGQCLFNSIAYVILYVENRVYPTKKQIIKYATELRKIAVKYLKDQIDNENIDIIISLSGSWKELNNNNNNNNNNVFNFTKSIENAYKYINKMSKKCTWGGHIEIKALETYIHSKGYKGIQVYQTSNDKLTKIRAMRTIFKRKHDIVIKILLLGIDQLGFHFQPIIEKPKKKISSVKIS